MRRQNKPIILEPLRLARAASVFAFIGASAFASSVASALQPLTLLAQDEAGPREIQIPNPMSAHTWFIIVAVGAFLAWCISYVLQLQKDKQSSHQSRRGLLLQQKEELLDRLAELEAEREAGSITAQRYEKEFRKAKGRLSEVVGRLGQKQDSPET